MTAEEKIEAYKNLRIALQLMDQVVDLFGGSVVQSSGQRRDRIVGVMAILLEDLEWLSSSTSELRPMKAAATRIEQKCNRHFVEAITTSKLCEGQGRLIESMECLAKYHSVCTSHFHRALALTEMERLRKMESLGFSASNDL